MKKLPINEDGFEFETSANGEETYTYMPFTFSPELIALLCADFGVPPALMRPTPVTYTTEPALMAKWFSAPVSPVAPTQPAMAPVVDTRTGAAPAGPQKGKLVPCSRSKWHAAHPANELCGECPRFGELLPSEQKARDALKAKDAERTEARAAAERANPMRVVDVKIDLPPGGSRQSHQIRGAMLDQLGNKYNLPRHLSNAGRWETDDEYRLRLQRTLDPKSIKPGV